MSQLLSGLSSISSSWGRQKPSCNTDTRVQIKKQKKNEVNSQYSKMIIPMKTVWELVVQVSLFANGSIQYYLPIIQYYLSGLQKQIWSALVRGDGT